MKKVVKKYLHFNVVFVIILIVDIVVRKSGKCSHSFALYLKFFIRGNCMAYNKTEQEVIKLLNPIIEAKNIDLWDIEFKKEGPSYVLRIFLDKDGGIGISDCEEVSRALSDVLDEADPIPQEYMLEVSSAGLDRAIKYDEHFKKCAGKNVDVKLFGSVDGVKEFTAELIGHTEESVIFKLDGEEKEFLKNKISSIRLTVEF